MKYPEKQEHARQAASLANEGNSFDEIRTRLMDQGLASYDVDAVWRSAKQILCDEHGETVRKILRRGDRISDSAELEAIAQDIRQQLVDFVMPDLVAEEIAKARRLMQQGADYEELEDQINFGIYPEEDLIKQVEAFNEEYEKLRKKERRATIGGFFLMLIFVLTLLLGGGARPLYLTGVAGAVLLYRSWQLRKQL